jgi:hypothetical protein
METRSIVPADNSGPNFDFSGEISPEFVGKLFQWAPDQAKKNEAHEPSDFKMSRDQSWAEVSWNWSGNSENSITIQENKGSFRMEVSGDGEEIDIPDSQFFAEGQYIDDQNEAFGILNGEAFSIHDLIEKLKEFKAQQKAKSATAQVP